jgi:hypothetical protein
MIIFNGVGLYIWNGKVLFAFIFVCCEGYITQLYFLLGYFFGGDIFEEERKIQKSIYIHIHIKRTISHHKISPNHLVNVFQSLIVLKNQFHIPF